ncbi:MAG: hypothetical protein LUD27_07550 [Clostridia bacterium]|nr:hypothetical protein [Clostridia bacterium]
MKVKISSLSDKKVRYKIYDLNGRRRKLLAKGKFLHNAEADVAPSGGEIIVQICRSVSPLSFLYVWFIQVVEAIADFYGTWHKLNYLFETKISDVKAGDTVEVVYTNATPERGKYCDAAAKLGEPDALYSTSHPCKKETSYRRKQIWLGTFISVMSACVIIAAVALIYFKFIAEW